MKISVYIPSYNQKELLRQAIDSVISQTLKPFEIIIVDDASTDDSQDMIREYEKKFPGWIRPFFFEKNQGVSKVRIKALSEVQGDYVTYVDGDDLFSPLKLEIESKLAGNGEFDLVFSNTSYFTGALWNISHIWASDKKKMPTIGNMYLQTFLRLFPRDSLFRMELVSYKLLKSEGFHDPNLKIFEDYELRIRLARKANINFTLLPLAYVRNDSHTLSKSSDEVYKESMKYIFDKHETLIRKSFPDKSALITERIEFFKNLRAEKKGISSDLMTDGLKGKIKGLFRKKKN
jgi:glycosyltransferase involved in cell wall biosynthesis